jgi:hypothetical protein
VDLAVPPPLAGGGLAEEQRLTQDPYGPQLGGQLTLAKSWLLAWDPSFGPEPGTLTPYFLDLSSGKTTSLT